MTDVGVIGAGYVSALLSEDDELRASYVQAFAPDELLQAINTQLLVLARRVARSAERPITLTELGSTLIEAALILHDHDIQL